MTTVTVSKKGTKYIFSAEGHSGYGPAGQDIVCAGVSALCFALAVSVRPYQLKHQKEICIYVLIKNISVN